MRTFYIFNINKEMSTITHDSPYMLFKSLELIYKGGKQDLNVATNLYEQIASSIGKQINEEIMNSCKDSDFYIYNGKTHNYYNKYRDEMCEMTIKNSFMICKSNYSKPYFFNKLNNPNFFICDFENKDYFWLTEIYC